MLIQKPRSAWQRAVRSGIDRTITWLKIALTFAPLLLLWLALPCRPVLLIGCVAMGLLHSLKQTSFLRAGRWRCIGQGPLGKQPSKR